MSKEIDLKALFARRKNQILSKAEISEVMVHPVDKGDNLEKAWLEWFKECLPQRYKAARAIVFDCNENTSEQIDIVIFDSQYSYLAFNQDDILYIPAESVYAVFEVKPEINKKYVEYAGGKAESVRKLTRTTAPIPYVLGKYPPKDPSDIIAGILTAKSGWSEPFGEALRNCLSNFNGDQRLNCGCVLNSGAFFYDYNSKTLKSASEDETLMYFFLQLLIQLQSLGTVPAIDLPKYIKVLNIKEETLIDGSTKGL